ncbi:hypothetical protein K7X08_025688 [Anisodus acutangulus]|uniref:Uncharacterized protein n=1 Tax=Anisodus acutangulus TaxID=402998 RepID=A0A9Q1R9A2_9SOLA|nr:hypothetical protein K7X08_025688 [Anisodus acutangulus]
MYNCQSRSPRCPRHSVNAVKFNEYSSVVISAGYDKSLHVWDCRSRSTEPIQIIDTFLDSVMSICLTKIEIIAGSVDGTIRTFDIRVGREISDNFDSTLRLLDRSSGELLQEYKGHICKSFKTDCCLTNSDAHVAGGSEDGYIYFRDLVDASVVSSFGAHDLVVTSVSYHPKESCMMTSSVDSTVRVWKAEIWNPKASDLFLITIHEESCVLESNQQFMREYRFT